MFPTVLRLGNLHIYSYGVMLFISFVCGIAIVEHRAKKFGVDPKKVTDLALWVLLAVVIGSRLFYVAFHWSEFSNDLIAIIAFWRGGLAGLMFYGGFLGGIIAGVLFVWLNKLPVRRLMDAVAPAIMLGEGFTRIGCFLNGCCFGGHTSSPFGVVFPPESPAGATFLGQPIHPTQLYSSAAGFALFLLALWLERRQLRPGVLAAILLIFYSLFRFGIDFVRYYENSANLWGNQVVALGLTALGVVLLILFLRWPAKGASTSSGTRR
ncbi:prolipoprotein diacylglyceryl transferase [candidate division WOR-3 bacterium]|uniref:Phosphatidylglycerol--prolipoprotein diacylglyceryl transferase n=1 Tax=candidate division WOR-3 bacterium TaxID=2052148 RepID=A0A938BTL5_UNCW3|nr:prolipoprotein diacylglyceryl transferase [candidate division WOR-3 bacterium]